MFGFGKKRSRKETVMVVSIESSHVRACFVDVEDMTKPYITKQSKASFATSHTSFGEYKKNMEHAIGTSLLALQKGMVATPSQIFCVLGNPWYVASSHTHTTEEDNPFKFNKGISQEILKEETVRFVSKVKNDYFSGLPVEVIEKKIIHLAINGYPVTTIPKNEKIRRADIVSYVSVTSESIIKDITTSINQHFHREVTFATSALSHFVAVRDIFDSVGSFLAVAITGDQTEIIAVDDGSLLSVANFPVGSNVLHKHSNSQGAHVQSVLTTVKDTNLPKNKKVSSVSVLAAREWQEGFEKIIYSLARNHSVQNSVVLLCDREYAEWFTSVIQDSRNKHLSTSNQNFRVIILDMETLHSYVGSKVPDADLELVVHTLFTTLNIL